MYCQNNSINKFFKRMEKKDLEREIKALEQGLSDYLRIFPILGVSEKEKERVINQYLDDINHRKKRVDKLK